MCDSSRPSSTALVLVVDRVAETNGRSLGASGCMPIQPWLDDEVTLENLGGTIGPGGTFYWVLLGNLTKLSLAAGVKDGRLDAGRLGYLLRRVLRWGPALGSAEFFNVAIHFAGGISDWLDEVVSVLSVEEMEQMAEGSEGAVRLLSLAAEKARKAGKVASAVYELGPADVIDLDEQWAQAYAAATNPEVAKSKMAAPGGIDWPASAMGHLKAEMLIGTVDDGGDAEAWAELELVAGPRVRPKDRVKAAQFTLMPWVAAVLCSWDVVRDSRRGRQGRECRAARVDERRESGAKRRVKRSTRAVRPQTARPRPCQALRVNWIKR